MLQHWSAMWCQRALVRIIGEITRIRHALIAVASILGCNPLIRSLDV